MSQNLCGIQPLTVTLQSPNMRSIIPVLKVTTVFSDEIFAACAMGLTESQAEQNVPVSVQTEQTPNLNINQTKTMRR